MDLLEKEDYAISRSFFPILNTPDFSSIFGGPEGNNMPIDDQGLIRAIESIGFPKTKCKIIAKNNHIVEIKTDDYPYKGRFFTDERFLKKAMKQTPQRKRNLPCSKEILKTISSLLGNRYFWGGNCLGLSEMMHFYPPQDPLSDSMFLNWTLQGFDCSGLMYYASKGTTPRNTYSWVFYGKPVLIEGKSLQEILSILKPLDAILWKGHIIFVQDSSYTIESRVNKGVIITQLKERFEELLESGKIPQNHQLKDHNQFLIRRWHPDSLDLAYSAAPKRAVCGFKIT